MIAWGLLGTGRINGAIIPAVRDSGIATIAGIASRDKARAEAYAAERGIPRSYGSYEELLADPGIDVIYNALPNALHAPWTIRALEAGKHVLVEKPFAIARREVDAIFAAAARAGRIVVDGAMHRYHPRLHALKRAIDEDRIGSPLFFRGTFTLDLGRPDNARWDPGLGGGCLWDVGFYPVSVARYVAGAMPVAMEASARRTGRGVDEHFTATLRFAGGMTAQIAASFAAQYRTHIEIVGTSGLLRLELPFRPDEPGSRLLLVRGDAESEIAVDRNPGRYRAEVDEMHERIATGRPASLDPEETRDVIALIENLHLLTP